MYLSSVQLVTLSHSIVVTYVISSKSLFTMIKMIFDKSSLTDDDLNQTVAAYSVPFIFRVVPITGDDNQCLQFSTGVFYKDVIESSKDNVLWNLVNWSNNTVMRYNDNAFVFNRILGYNTAFFDIKNKSWYWKDCYEWIYPLAFVD